MRRFSVVVAVHDIEGFVRRCLRSLVDQTFDDFEVIVVDDASTDNSGMIADEVGRGDPRVRVLHLEENVGLGPARNVGLEHAVGEYVLFVDGDDWVERGALEAIDRRLLEAPADVLIFDYARVRWDGRTQRNRLASLFRADLPDTFTLREHPEFLHMLQVVWNKAYRRGFIEELGVRFPPGYYEDTPWTYPIMVSAGSIAVLDKVCYFYRQRRFGNILRTTSRKHFDIFEQWTRVYAFLDEHPHLEAWRVVLFQRMVSHLITILQLRERRLPRGTEREFFERASEHYRRYEPSDLESQRESRALGPRLLGRGAYRTFRLVQLARRMRIGAPTMLRRRASRTRSRLRGVVVGLRLRAYRSLFVRMPLDDRLVVFAAYWYRGVACNPKAIYERLDELAGSRFRCVWVVAGKHRSSMPEGVPYVVEGSLAYYWALARAKYLVNNVNFPNVLVKRRGSVHLQTHHGTPLKTMGVDLIDYPAAARRMNFTSLVERAERWDYSLSSNRLSSEVWARTYPADFENLEYGYPRNDIFYRHTSEDVARAREQLGLSDDRTVVLYAPTHREYRREFESEIDLPRLCRRLSDDYLFLVRAHYFYQQDDDTIRELAESGAVLDVSGHLEVEPLCLASDVLLTDYSSIMFDFANLGRPIVVFADDWETYRTVRGAYFDLLREAPGPVALDEDELIRILEAREFESDSAERRLKEFQSRFCELDDGHAAERVVRRVFFGEEA